MLISRTRREAVAGLVFGVTILRALQPTESRGEPLPIMGYLANKTDNPDRLKAFRQAMAELGYIEGKNIAIEFRLANLDNEYVDLATELVALRVNLILAGVAPAAVAARRVTGTIPRVIAQVNDPV